MNHPLTRIFAPIFMIVLVAANMVVITTVDTDNRTAVAEAMVAIALTETDELPTAAVSQTTTDRS